jgi:hypothetical protein
MTRFEVTLGAFALGAGLFLTGLPASANDTFPLFFGTWTGEGTIAWKSDGSKERMKCTSTYAQGVSAEQLSLKFQCKSDNYVFDLDGKLDAGGDQISGQWSERSRNIGGATIGQVKADRIKLRIESSAFGANLLMVVKDDRQQVQIKFSGAGEEADTEISLKRQP